MEEGMTRWKNIFPGPILYHFYSFEMGWFLGQWKTGEMALGPFFQSHTQQVGIKQSGFNSCSATVRLFASPRTAAHYAPLSSTVSWSLLKFMSIELVMPSNHLIFCHSLLLLPSVFPSIRVFPNESALCTRWPKYWSFSFGISPSNEYS